MSKFTKGPWDIKFNGGETQIIAGKDVLMSDMTYYPWNPENVHDWHLIAAAPDMYDALEELLGFIELECDAIWNARKALDRANGL